MSNKIEVKLGIECTREREREKGREKGRRGEQIEIREIKRMRE